MSGLVCDGGFGVRNLFSAFAAELQLDTYLWDTTMSELKTHNMKFLYIFIHTIIPFYLSWLAGITDMKNCSAVTRALVLFCLSALKYNIVELD